jgi:broad specificity phosphatase PhoE
MPRIKRIYFVRHGQSEGNVDNRKYFEKHDSQISLTDLGATQATNAGIMINQLVKRKLWKFHVCCSPYIRAVDTKNKVVEFLRSVGHSITKFREDPRLRERTWGGLRDIAYNEEATEDHFMFFYKPLGGESYADCYERAANFDQWLESNAAEEDVIIIAHGEFIRCYMMYKLGWTIDEHDTTATPWNGQVLLLERYPDSDEYYLSANTPLRFKKVKKVEN